MSELVYNYLYVIVLRCFICFHGVVGYHVSFTIAPLLASITGQGPRFEPE